MVVQSQLRACKRKPRVLIITDITNEPDDSESLVRYLLYSNELDTRGLVACTSTHMRSRVAPYEIESIVNGYGEVVDNLNAHAHPDEPIPERTKPSGYDQGRPPDLIIARVDESEEPLWVLLWGGANTLAQAISHVEKTRNVSAFTHFRSKIRVYAISDQDDTGAWIRVTYPDIFYICSIHGWCQYTSAAWTGVSGPTDPGGADPSQFTREWIKHNIQIGPLGTKYPDFKFLVEGDTPTFLYLIQNGLSSPEHPHWGSWGGRYSYFDPAMTSNHFADAADSVVGMDGRTYTSNFATIWRWRRAFQDDFAARMQWTLTNDPCKTNHAPVVFINDSNGGSEPVLIEVEAGDKLFLDASKSYDPDGDDITFNWFQYKEPTSVQGWPEVLTGVEITTIDLEGPGDRVEVQIPCPEVSAQEPISGQAVAKGHEYHIVLEVRDNGAPSMTTYKRVVIQTTNKALRGSRGSAVATTAEWLELRK